MASRAEVMENSGGADLKYQQGMEDPAQPQTATKVYELHLGQASKEDQTPICFLKPPPCHLHINRPAGNGSGQAQGDKQSSS